MTIPTETVCVASFPDYAHFIRNSTVRDEDREGVPFRVKNLFSCSPVVFHLPWWKKGETAKASRVGYSRCYGIWELEIRLTTTAAASQVLLFPSLKPMPVIMTDPGR